MRLGTVLVVSFLAIAALVGIVGRVFSSAGNQVQLAVDDLRRTTIACMLHATELRFSLQASQLEAEKLIAERYRAQVDASHESEWNVAGNIDLDDIEDSLDAFEKQLAASRASVEATRSRVVPGASSSSTTANELGTRLRAVENEFGIYRDKVDRFVHLARYHPSDQVREFVDDDLLPHYRDRMLPAIADFEAQTQADLTKEVERIEAALARSNRRNRVISGLALAAAAILGLLITRSITGPISKLEEAALAVGRGRLENPVQVRANNELGLLAEAFNRMMEDLRESTVSRSHLDKILQSMQDMLLVTDAERRIRTCNRLTEEALGVERRELIGRPIDELVAEGSASLPTTRTPVGTGEVELLDAAGTALTASYSSAVLTDENGAAEGQVFVLRDIRERKRAEEALRSSLTEKEALLKEVHHRVKNNLQIVSSLLHLQERDITGSDDVRRFRESQNRIRSMALIHEQLYRSQDLASIDFGTYLEQLVKHLISSYGGAETAVATHLEVDAVPLSIDYAIPCGLIVNELVANALEHAFPDGAGTIAIRFATAGGQHCLEFSDDGVGMEDVDPSTSTSLGLRLIDALAAQLGGTYEFRVDAGTRFRLTYDPSVEAQRESA